MAGYLEDDTDRSVSQRKSGKERAKGVDDEERLVRMDKVKALRIKICLTMWKVLKADTVAAKTFRHSAVSIDPTNSQKVRPRISTAGRNKETFVCDSSLGDDTCRL